MDGRFRFGRRSAIGRCRVGPTTLSRTGVVIEAGPWSDEEIAAERRRDRASEGTVLRNGSEGRAR